MLRVRVAELLGEASSLEVSDGFFVARKSNFVGDLSHLRGSPQGTQKFTEPSGGRSKILGFRSGGQEAHQGLHFVFVLSVLGSEVHSPEFVLRLLAFDAGVEFVGADLANPHYKKLGLARTTLEFDRCADLQMGAKTTQFCAGAADINGVREMSGAVDGYFYGQDYLPTRRFAAFEH